MIDFEKGNGLIPVIVQHELSLEVLMLGYMNQEALDATLKTGKVTFYSRSKQRLWTKGESSGNYLELVSYAPDCDKDSLLIKALPKGPTCHLGTDSCFGYGSPKRFLYQLEDIIDSRSKVDSDASYTASLFKSGINKVAQKVGEEAIEVVIEATNGSKTLLQEESADLLFHLMVLLRSKEISLLDIETVLKKRHEKTQVVNGA